jgi:lipopolysaccharide assembly LptE-like protein
MSKFEVRILLGISRLRLDVGTGRFTDWSSAIRTLNLELRTSTFALRASCFVLCLVFLFGTLGCGYRLAGKATAIPASIDSVAIPIFNNQTTKYRLEQRLTSAVVDEFVSRTRYRIVPDASQAKALLTGEVIEFTSTPVIFAGGAGATFLVTVRMRVSMKDTATQKLLFENNNFYFREEFEISRGSKEFFPEEGPAMDRLAREFSRTLVSSILEAF